MVSSELIFKSVAVLHGVAGYVLFAFAADEDFQKFCFYKNRNPLAGDAYKYLVLAACLALVACGVLAFFVPIFAVGAAWLSIALYLLTGLVDIVDKGRWPAFCK